MRAKSLSKGSLSDGRSRTSSPCAPLDRHDAHSLRKPPMTQNAQRLLDAYLSEQRQERLLERASWVISLTCFALVLVSTILMGRIHPFFVFVTLFGIISRLSTLIAAKAFDAPELLRAATRDDEAMQLLRAHGADLLQRLLVHELLPSTHEAVAALSNDDIARLEVASNGLYWRQFAMRYGVVYALLLLAALTGTVWLLVTGDGSLVGQS